MEDIDIDIDMDRFQVRFWGVRGSLASAAPAQAQVGGNTSCVQVTCGDRTFILDAGTGIRALGARLMTALPSTPLTLLLTHYHWDHIQGLPFFLPAYRPEVELAIYAPLIAEAPDVSVRAHLAGQMQPPYFPVGLEALQAQLGFTDLLPGQSLALGDVHVRTAATRHPGGGLAYRLDYRGRALVLATDTEHDPSAGPDANLVGLARGADLLIYDAQYTEEEFASKRGWGHSTPGAGVALAEAAGVPRLALYHHDPAHDDWTVARMEAAARTCLPGAVAAREGLTIDLTGARLISAAQPGARPDPARRVGQGG